MLRLPRQKEIMDANKLQEYFHFDEADLEANRKGRLTEKQKKRFTPSANDGRWAAWGLGLFFLLIAGLGVFVAVQFFLEEKDWVARIIFGLGFGVLWPLAWGGIGVGMLKPSRRPVSNPRVKAERGPLKVVRHEPQDAVPYNEIKVGSRSIETDCDLSDVIEEGDEYLLYYLQKTGQAVSLERVEKAK